MGFPLLVKPSEAGTSLLLTFETWSHLNCRLPEKNYAAQAEKKSAKDLANRLYIGI